MLYVIGYRALKKCVGQKVPIPSFLLLLWFVIFGILGGGTGAVVIGGIAGSNPTQTFKFQINKMFLPCSLVKIRYCGEPNSVSIGQCHLIHLTILRRFSWPSLAYVCTKVG